MDPPGKQDLENDTRVAKTLYQSQGPWIQVSHLHTDKHTFSVSALYTQRCFPRCAFSGRRTWGRDPKNPQQAARDKVQRRGLGGT